jgi:hypothetical protein
VRAAIVEREGPMRTLICLMAVCWWGAAPADAAPKPKPAKVQHTIRGATQMFVAKWGLAAQGSGMLRVLPLGKTKWQILRQVPHGSLYRIAFDDGGRMLAWWEEQEETSIFMFVVGSGKKPELLALPTPPDATFTYGFRVEDMFFAPDGKGAIVYMHGFKGGRTWETVAYHYDLAGGAPTMLFRQPGHVLHTSAHGTIRAVPKDPAEMCEDAGCHLGSVIAWEINGAKATKHVLLDGAGRKEYFSRLQPVWGNDEESTHVAVTVTEHPSKRHLLRYKWGDAKATMTLLPKGPDFDTSHIGITRNGDVIEAWLTPEERGLEIRRHPVKGAMTTLTLAPHPKRTPKDHPLFDVPYMKERTNGDILLQWGEYLLLVPPTGPARHLDLRSVFNRRIEFSGRLLYVPDPEGVWVGISAGKNEDFTFLTQADLDARMSPAP